MATFTGSEAASNHTLVSGPGLRSGPGPLRKRLGEVIDVLMKCDHWQRLHPFSRWCCLPGTTRRFSLLRSETGQRVVKLPDSKRW